MTSLICWRLFRPQTAASKAAFAIKSATMRHGRSGALAFCLAFDYVTTRSDHQKYSPMRTTLPIRVKKFIGVFFIVLLVVVYSLVAVAIASATLANAPWYAHMLYFMFSGVLWIVPAMVIIKWMSTES